MGGIVRKTGNLQSRYFVTMHGHRQFSVITVAFASPGMAQLCSLSKPRREEFESQDFESYHVPNFSATLTANEVAYMSPFISLMFYERMLLAVVFSLFRCFLEVRSFLDYRLSNAVCPNRNPSHVTEPAHYQDGFISRHHINAAQFQLSNCVLITNSSQTKCA